MNIEIWDDQLCCLLFPSGKKVTQKVFILFVEYILLSLFHYKTKFTNISVYMFQDQFDLVCLSLLEKVVKIWKKLFLFFANICTQNTFMNVTRKFLLSKQQQQGYVGNTFPCRCSYRMKNRMNLEWAFVQEKQKSLWNACGCWRAHKHGNEESVQEERILLIYGLFSFWTRWILEWFWWQWVFPS